MATQDNTEEAREIIAELRANYDQLSEEERNTLARYERDFHVGYPTDLPPQTEGGNALAAIGEFAKPAILPTIGSVAGRAAGTAFPILGPMTPMVGGGVGGGAGEAINQLTGITEPSLTQIAVQTGLPMAVEGLSNLYRTGRVLGATKGPETINKLAYPAAQGKLQAFAPSKASGPLFEQSAQQGVTVPVEKTWKLINAIVENPNISKVEKKAFADVLKQTGLSEFLTKDPAGMNPAKLQRVLNAVGELTPSAEGYAGGHLKRLFGALSQDLDDAAQSGMKGAGVLQEARQVFKREKVLDDIGNELEKAFTLNRGQMERQFNANKIVRTLEDQKGHIGRFFRQAFNPAEQKDLLGFFEFLNTIPSLKPGAGAQYGSGRLLARSVSSMAAGGAAGFASTGTPVGSAIGTVAGAALPAVDDMMRIGLQVWKMPGGKSLLKNVLTNSSGALTPQVLATLTAFATTQTARPPAEVSRAGTLRPMPTAR